MITTCEADEAHRQQLPHPSPACTPLPHSAQTDTAPTEHPAGTCLEKSRCPTASFLFPPMVQPDLPAASQGSGSSGVTVQWELPWQLGCVPKGCRCSQDTGLSHGSGIAARAQQVKVLLSSTHGASGCDAAVPMVGKDGTNASHLYQVSSSLSLLPPWNMLPAFSSCAVPSHPAS